jgi:hypothetical protein
MMRMGVALASGWNNQTILMMRTGVALVLLLHRNSASLVVVVALVVVVVWSVHAGILMCLTQLLWQTSHSLSLFGSESLSA